MKKKHIAYDGVEFTIEWYFDDRGRSGAREYYQELAQEQQKKLTHLFYVLGETGEIRNKEKFRNEEDKIYAFKIPQDRFLCFFYDGSKVIITNAFEKKQQKMPPKEKEKALKIKSTYIKRCKEGSYYD